jgi:uncharacterized membrane protein (UPF0127 family)
MRLPAFFCLALIAPWLAWAQSGPQPTLPTTKLVISGHGGPPHAFAVELAQTPEQQQIGEMFRTSIPEGTGMFFDWGYPHEVPMWMKNCPVPEDMIFIGADGTITHIAEDTVPESEAEISSGGPVRATLEVQGGLTAKLDIRVGDKVAGAIFK